MIIDTHTHLDLDEFESDREMVVKSAAEAGIATIINPGVDLESSRKATQISQKFGGVFAAVGIQPEEVDQYFQDVPDLQFLNPRKIKIDIRSELERLAKHKKVVAVGECGLDYKFLREKYKGERERELEKEKQKDIFRRQLGTAVLLDLPAIIHNREAESDVLSEIERYQETKKLRGVFHCFNGTLELAKKIFCLGFMISLTGIVTYPNAEELRKVVRELPLEKIMVETDSPFLAPQAHRGKRNEPAFIVEVIKEIARIKSLDFNKVASVTSQNARRLFKV